MEPNGDDIKSETVDTALNHMKIEENSAADGKVLNTSEGPTPADRDATPNGVKELTPGSPKVEDISVKSGSASHTPKSEGSDQEDVVGGEISVKLENGKPPKLSRRPSQKIVARPPPLFNDSPDATEEAVSVFQVMADCIYGSKYMGSSEHDALGCDCSEEWRRFSHRHWVEPY
jgi:hypothetical protein